MQPVIAGIQSQKVIANAKHYVLNNQETNRGAVIADTDERTRFEMYYPLLRGATEAGVGSVMCSCCVGPQGWRRADGRPLVVREPLAFAVTSTRMGSRAGLSDWGATHSTSWQAWIRRCPAPST